MTVRIRRITATAVSIALATVAVACGTTSAPSVSAPSSTQPSSSASAPVSSSSAPVSGSALPAVSCATPEPGFDCAMGARFAAVQRYLGHRPGTVGIVLRDRKTGAVWRNQHAGDMTWTASTIKLGMTVDLLLRDRSGQIDLSSGDRALIKAMLHVSDDDAADTLWHRYGGSDHHTFNADLPRYGMTSLTPQKGFSSIYPYWGFQKCTADDLDRLINYVLTKLPATLRTYLVGEMSAVGADQQWGVWGAGTAVRPGNKDGWSKEQGGWVMNSVGFAGPAQRYTLSIMNNLRGQGGYDDGKQTDSKVAALLLGQAG